MPFEMINLVNFTGKCLVNGLVSFLKKHTEELDRHQLLIICITTMEVIS